MKQKPKSRTTAPFLTVGPNRAKSLVKADALTVAAGRNLVEAGQACIGTTRDSLDMDKFSTELYGLIRDACLDLKAAAKLHNQHLSDFMDRIIKEGKS